MFLQRTIFTSIAAICIGIFCTFPLHADWALHPQAGEKPSQALEYSLAFSANTGIECNSTYNALCYRFDFAPYESFIGFQTSGDICDITLASTWWAVKSQHEYNLWTFGIEGIYHYQHYDGIYGEHDAVLYYSLRSQRTNGFEFLMKTGGSLKFANVYAVDETVFSKDVMGFIQVGKTWNERFKLYTSVSSHSLFRYPRFLAPRAIVGAFYTFDGGFQPCVELEAGFSDFFATALYANAVIVRLTGRFLL